MNPLAPEFKPRSRLNPNAKPFVPVHHPQPERIMTVNIERIEKIANTRLFNNKTHRLHGFSHH